MNYHPRNRIVEVAATSSSVVDIADLRAFARAHGVTDDDDILTAAEKAAVATIEHDIQRLLISRGVVLRLPDLPSARLPIELPGGDVSAVASVVADGDTITGATAYGRSPAILVPGADWPAVTGEGYPVEITYTAGFSTVPADLVEAIKKLTLHFYDMPGIAIVGASVASLPLGYEHILKPHRIRPI